MRFPLWLVTALIVGCGRYDFEEHPDAAPVPVVPPPPAYHSGTRLRAEIQEVGDARLFATWFDTQLGEECSLAVAEDGVTRCLPSRLVAGQQFSDPTCTTPLVTAIVPADTTNCPSADQLARITIGDRVRVVHVGTTYGGTAYQGQTAQCVMLGSGGGITYFTVTATDQRSTCRTDFLDATIGDELTTIYDIDPQQGCIAQPTTATRRMFRAASIVPLASMASGVREVPAGGRIVVAGWRFTQGRTLPYMFFDTMHDDLCYVIDVSDLAVSMDV